MKPKARLDIRALDGLRGIASLHIAVQHYVDYLTPGGPDLMGSGTVTLFLVLSGFVMAIGYGRRKVIDCCVVDVLLFHFYPFNILHHCTGR